MSTALEHAMECQDPRHCETCAELTEEELDEILVALVVDRLVIEPIPYEEMGGEA